MRFVYFGLLVPWSPLPLFSWKNIDEDQLTELNLIKYETHRELLITLLSTGSRDLVEATSSKANIQHWQSGHLILGHKRIVFR